jgi:hypothetical protein
MDPENDERDHLLMRRQAVKAAFARWTSRLACVVFCLCFAVWLAGWLSGPTVRVPISRPTIYALETKSGFLIGVRRRVLLGEHGRLVVSFGGGPPVSEEELDFTNPLRTQLGMDDIRRYSTRWTCAGIAYQTADEVIAIQRGNNRWSVTTSPNVAWVVAVPWWPVLVLTAAIPCRVVFKTVVRRVRLRRHWCPQCGYDLRATKDRCPECGAKVPDKWIKLQGDLCTPSK